jgi:hypothetical protein
MILNAETNQEALLFSELTVQDYKKLLKTSYGDNPNLNNFIATLTEVFSNVSNKSKEYFYNLDILTIFLFLIDLRIQTFGETCEILLKPKQATNFKKTTISLNLNSIKNELLKFQSNYKIVNLLDDKIKIVLNPPTILGLLSKKYNYFDFIKKIEIFNETINGYNTFETKSNLKEIFDEIPAKYSFVVIKEYNEFINKLTSINFLERYKISDTKLTFIPDFQTLIWYFKLFFNESLEGFYQNLFYLTYLGHFNLQYIETCAVGEYLWFVRKLEGTLSTKQSFNNTQQSVDTFDDIIEDSN